MASQSRIFTSSGTWTAPQDVSAVFWTSTGGGSGTPGARDKFNANGTVGGGGSAELVCNKLIPVIPSEEYEVIVGQAGVGASYNTSPTAAGPSTFAGFRVLGAKEWLITDSVTGSHLMGPEESGAGGGPGGSIGCLDGGLFDPKGKRECCHYTGGSGGGEGSPRPESQGTLGGLLAEQGPLATAGSGVGGTTPGGGGAGGASIWGGNNGAQGAQGQSTPDPSAYGAGAGASGEPATNIIVQGSNGSPGVVILKWFGPAS